MLDFSDHRQLAPEPHGLRLVDFVALLRARAEAAGLGRDASALKVEPAAPMVDAAEREVVVWLDGALEEIGPPRRVEADMVGPGRVCFTVSGLRGATSRLFDLPGAGQPFAGDDAAGAPGAVAA